MTALWTGLALLLPLLLGASWLHLLIPRQVPARAALVWGYGALLGTLAVPLLMAALHSLSCPLSFALTAAVSSVLLAVGLALARQRHRRAPTLRRGSPSLPLSRGEGLLCLLLLALMLLRLATLGAEILWRPLFPWDATMHWATKARVWFEHRAMLPFVDTGTWLELQGREVFTDRHPDYPPTIPLLQVWMNLAVGEWHDSLMNLPWLTALAGLGAAFYGQLRLAGVATVVALAATYLLLSMPLLNIHVALAGYADIFLAATYCASLMALHNWLQRREPWLAVLAAVFALLCPMIKQEGAIWLLTLPPALLAILLLTGRRAILSLALPGAAVLALLLVAPDLRLAGHPLNQLWSGFEPSAMRGIATTLWLHDNWHLAAYLLPLLLLPGALSHRYRGLTVALGCAGGAFVFLFLFTGFSWGASNLSAVGRLALQLVPGVLFLLALRGNELLAGSAAPGSLSASASASQRAPTGPADHAT